VAWSVPDPVLGGSQETESGQNDRWVGPLVVFALAVLAALVIAVYQITVAYGAVVLENGARETRVPLSLGQTVFALSFAVWPMVAFLGTWQRAAGIAWVATGVYLLLGFLFGFSFGGQHLVVGGPLMLVGSVWATLLRDARR
jgi:hypothetical protein